MSARDDYPFKRNQDVAYVDDDLYGRMCDALDAKDAEIDRLRAEVERLTNRTFSEKFNDAFAGIKFVDPEHCEACGMYEADCLCDEGVRRIVGDDLPDATPDGLITSPEATA